VLRAKKATFCGSHGSCVFELKHSERVRGIVRGFGWVVSTLFLGMTSDMAGLAFSNEMGMKVIAIRSEEGVD
jgi:hypothetical protein